MDSVTQLKKATSSNGGQKCKQAYGLFLNDPSIYEVLNHFITHYYELFLISTCLIVWNEEPKNESS